MERGSGTTPRSFERRLTVSLLILLAVAIAPSAQASNGWVNGDYYGINFQQLRELKPSERGKHLARIAKLGIHDIRVGFAWPRLEPLPPVNGQHQYRWTSFDGEIASLARHGIRAQANITQTPRWNADTSIIGAINCNRSSSWAPLDIGPYGPLAKAIAARYGRGGTFWRAHPDVPAKPIVRYEIWNEPNLRGGWCPNPQPERYADMFMIAASAIRSVDHQAQIVTGGVAPPAKQNRHYLAISEFLGRATARQPGLIRKASGSAVHIYPPTGAGKQLDRVAWFREQLRQGGIPNRTPMLINEIGWPTGGSSSAVSEEERAKAYTMATVNIPRTNCNVMGMLPQSWTSNQINDSNPEDWYGIAGPVTAKPYPSARAYSHAVKLMRGQLSDAPPADPLMVCPGMAPPKPPGGGGTPNPCTIVGTPAPDRLVGTSKRDVICAFGNRDVIRTKGGRDTVLGGGGRDRILGGRGPDRLKGGAGRDKVKGARGRDFLVGQRGGDKLGGGRGNDKIKGGPGRDKLSGGPGADLLAGGPSGDVLRGGRGHDRLRGGAGHDRKFP
ncbi:MAG TPA: calcium-binding protein [Solirubrobacterales bacterium]|nr:calcium-binding protein [Solirubrobacterales bacterium]